jgi:hypothetical protein
LCPTSLTASVFFSRLTLCHPLSSSTISYSPLLFLKSILSYSSAPLSLPPIILNACSHHLEIHKANVIFNPSLVSTQGPNRSGEEKGKWVS